MHNVFYIIHEMKISFKIISWTFLFVLYVGRWYEISNFPDTGVGENKSFYPGEKAWVCFRWARIPEVLK